MPRFKVCVQQFVEEIAEIEVEADTPENAARQVDEALNSYDYDEPDWRDGDDVQNRRIYAIRDEHDNEIWKAIWKWSQP